MDPLKLGDPGYAENIVQETVRQIKSSEPASGFSEINYPGERTLQTRKENLEKGIPVDDTIWDTVKRLAK